MKHRDFVLVDPLDQKERELPPAFLQYLQEAVIYALESRQLVTADQREQCVQALAKQNRKKTVSTSGRLPDLRHA